MTDADLAFRAETKAWLVANVPRDPQPEDGVAMREFDMAWQAKQYEGGWAGISWPEEYGGRALSSLRQMIWHEEYARAGGPKIGTGFVGVNEAGPTLMLHGTEAQRRKHLPRILRGEEVWAQGYSEPGAGSDLAAMSTTGVVDGDDIVITGEKIWTSYADISDFQELLVRTNPDAPKHQGITWLICPLDPRPPGLTVQPIQTISGPRHLCRVAYDDVRIPLTNVVGEIDAGWHVVSSSLYLKRGTGRIADQVSLARAVEDLIATARLPGPDGGPPPIEDDEIARRLATARAEVAALRAMTYAELSRVDRNGTPGAEGSMGRIFHGELGQRVRRLAMDVLGPEALELGVGGRRDWVKEYLWSFTETIGGGTSDIQRNVIGERVLGLPRDR
jgi:alkylation response protein AidB-like acyl-CoA dehydrogenase